ncbi:MAG: helix-turn-helix domain-containing protein [Massilioclostridium sp.]|nr:helix-turn-helix domain-containing protein [Massilioclostridium sp.]MEE1490775.1 helix-turn-helix domain-containing protein [Massilioclostridium sp.]
MNQRIQEIAEAATVLFLQQGYAKTQISHIAKAVGVSVGTIYLDFTGKKEIMHFILKRTIEPDFNDREFDRPITDHLFAGLEEQIISCFEQSGREFAAHLHETDQYSLELLVSDAFDLLARYAAGCLFIEKNQFDFKKLAEHYKRYRKQFFETMTQYLQKFMEAGTVRPLQHLELTTTLIIEMLSWWAMDIRYTSFETQPISMELAKTICMDNILAAYKKIN